MKTQRIPRILLAAAMTLGLATASQSQVVLDAAELPANDTYEITELPGFPGGKSALMLYISESLKYPEEAKNSHTEGDVIVEFTIGKDGCITDSTILRGLGQSCDAEVLRLIDEMPCWSPAAVDGKRVASKYVLPVRFSLGPTL